jgi:hypothetical protein
VQRIYLQHSDTPVNVRWIKSRRHNDLYLESNDRGEHGVNAAPACAVTIGELACVGMAGFQNQCIYGFSSRRAFLQLFLDKITDWLCVTRAG